MNRPERNPLRRLLWSLLAVACGVALLWAAHACPLFCHDRSDSRGPMGLAPSPPAAQAAAGEQLPGLPQASEQTWAVSIAKGPLASNRNVESLTEAAMPELGHRHRLPRPTRKPRRKRIGNSPPTRENRRPPPARLPRPPIAVIDARNSWSSLPRKRTATPAVVSSWPGSGTTSPRGPNSSPHRG